ncbi:hypothetical protein PPERSA_11258 [Pseudocohnilembus persalinus]|uniref:Telomerase reverse transcriptase n=1 Tax=Pseudocohnilembus persalinus TaxID=266149 RepID=A0A0V0R041_PSEPJ|nr:hypothetical protein PPERSA_11258 [Pseudocohnilembus persalinus]|eukprot:KRX07709.1 hypothetical protein PPERSA_11258 [Pseudocohnilembus persalinus]
MNFSNIKSNLNPTVPDFISAPQESGKQLLSESRILNEEELISFGDLYIPNEKQNNIQDNEKQIKQQNKEKICKKIKRKYSSKRKSTLGNFQKNDYKKSESLKNKKSSKSMNHINKREFKENVVFNKIPDFLDLINQNKTNISTIKPNSQQQLIIKSNSTDKNLQEIPSQAPNSLLTKQLSQHIFTYKKNNLTSFNILDSRSSLNKYHQISNLEKQTVIVKLMPHQQNCQNINKKVKKSQTDQQDKKQNLGRPNSIDLKDPLLKPVTQNTQNDNIKNKCTIELPMKIGQNIQYLQNGGGQKNFVQSLGLQGQILNNINLTRKYLINTNIEILYNIIGENNLEVILSQYLLFAKVEKAVKKQKQVNKDPYEIASTIVDRRKMFYCNHMGRKNGIFKGSFFYKSEKSAKVLAFQESHLFYNKKIVDKQFHQTLNDYLTMIIKNFRKCNFEALIINFSPLPKNYKILKQKINQQIKQAYYPFNKELILQQLEELFKELHSHCNTYQQVIQLTKQITKKIIPVELLGKENFEEFKRYENIKIQNLICQMDVFKLPWAQNKIKFSKKHSYIIIKRLRKVLADILMFIFNELVIPYLRYNFYITEKHKENNKIFYYRKPLWLLITKLAIYQLKNDNLTQITKNTFQEKFLTQNPPIAKLRILPKKSSFRPIMTFNRKYKLDNKSNFLQNINQILQDPQLVLRNLKQILSQNGRYSVFDNSQIFKKFQNFIQNWTEIGKPQLYVLSLDIQKCYDSIDQQKLLKIFEQTDLIDPSYLINKYILFTRNKRPLNLQQKGKKDLKYYYNLRERACAVSLFDIQNLKQGGFQEQEKDQRPQIIINQGKCKAITKDQIYSMLKHVCGQQIIQFENKLFIQKFGIPQGLNVSSVLCSFYFNHIEQKLTISQQQKQELKQKNKSNNNIISLLMRLTDDYIFLSNDKEQAANFKKEIEMLGKDNKFSLNINKIGSNFDFLEIKNYLQNGKLVPYVNKIEKSLEKNVTWIGKNINFNNLSITPAFEKDFKKNSYSMNVNIPGKAKIGYLMNKLKSLLMNQFQDYFNPKINDDKILSKNLTIFAATAAQKFLPFIEQYKNEIPSEIYKTKKKLSKLKTKISEKREKQLEAV